MVRVTMDCVCIKSLVLRVHFPTASWKYVFVPLIPFTIHNLAGMAFILLNPDIVGHPNVFVNVEIEEWARLPACTVFDEFIKCHIVWDDKVLFHIHDVVQGDCPQFGEI